MLEKKVERLEKIVEETSGIAMNISPRSGKWSCYLLQKKKTFSQESLENLLDDVAEHIEKHREKVEVTKKQTKPYKYK